MAVKKNKNTRVDLTPAQIEQCEKYAVVGLNFDQIAALCDVSPTTFDEILKRQPEVARAIEKGRSRGIGGVANTLYQQAMSGNMTAVIFYLKTQGRWKENDPLISNHTNIIVSKDNVNDLIKIAREKAQISGQIVEVTASESND